MSPWSLVTMNTVRLATPIVWTVVTYCPTIASNSAIIA
jgi:hypothetical protein